MIKKSEISKLLAFAAAYEQRTIGDADIEAWHAAGELGRWNFLAVRRVIVEHYSRDADRPRIDPATINDRIRGLRNQAAESFEAPVISAVQDVPYPEWYRAQLRGHVDAQLERWATTGQEPDRAQPAIAGHRSLAEVIASAPAHVRAELEAGARKINQRGTR